MTKISIFLLLPVIVALANSSSTEDPQQKKLPTVLVAILIRNKAHTLPYFLSLLERQDYPKDRISLWIRSDHNEDRSVEAVQTWLSNETVVRYHSVDFAHQPMPARRKGERSFAHWSRERFSAVIRLKEQALAAARRAWADYIFFLDADALLTVPETLSYLISLDLPIAAPMLKSESLYSNFWCAMTEEFYYARNEDYKPIVNREKMGEFAVPMVHAAVLVNLRLAASDFLTFDKSLLNRFQMERGERRYDGPDDDIITFAMSANYSGLSMFVSNKYKFGYITVPLEATDSLARDVEKLVNILMLMVNDLDEIYVRPDLQQFAPPPRKDTMTLSHIFMINLERRPERRIKMERSFDILGLDVEYFPAVDGKLLTDDVLKEKGVEFLAGYLDPYHKRPMTTGEIGCFLSHYYVWQKIVESGYKEVLVLEDDIRFEHYFRASALAILDEARSLDVPWDLIYFGRKRLLETDEPWVKNAQYLVHAGYSYWTLGYVITQAGAQKLLNAQPIKQMVPVDEYLPIMFDKHPKVELKVRFRDRNLIAFSAAPLILYPTHYTGEDGYISDTEESQVIGKGDEEEGSERDELAEKKGKKSSLDEHSAGRSEEEDEDGDLELDNLLSSTISQTVGISSDQGHSEL